VGRGVGTLGGGGGNQSQGVLNGRPFYWRMLTHDWENVHTWQSEC
jgi:hypothetical protein